MIRGENEYFVLQVTYPNGEVGTYTDDESGTIERAKEVLLGNLPVDSIISDTWKETKR